MELGFIITIVISTISAYCAYEYIMLKHDNMTNNELIKWLERFEDKIENKVEEIRATHENYGTRVTKLEMVTKDVPQLKDTVNNLDKSVIELNLTLNQMLIKNTRNAKMYAAVVALFNVSIFVAYLIIKSV